MIEFTPVSINLNGFEIYYYGIILAMGALAGILLADFRAKKTGMDEEFLFDSLPWVIFGGIPGAVIGGLLLFYWFARRKGEPFSSWLDILTPSIPLGQAIGRWGNFVNQELYGTPTDLPWGIFIDEVNRLPGFMDKTHFHPIFFYESLWNLGTVFLLIWIGNQYRQQLKAGDLFLMYLISYPLIRFLLDFLRLDASEIAGVNANQTVMLVVMVLAAVALLFRHRTRRTDNRDEGGDL